MLGNNDDDDAAADDDGVDVDDDAAADDDGVNVDDDAAADDDSADDDDDGADDDDDGADDDDDAAADDDVPPRGGSNDDDDVPPRGSSNEHGDRHSISFVSLVCRVPDMEFDEFVDTAGNGDGQGHLLPCSRIFVAFVSTSRSSVNTDCVQSLSYWSCIQCGHILCLLSPLDKTI